MVIECKVVDGDIRKARNGKLIGDWIVRVAEPGGGSSLLRVRVYPSPEKVPAGQVVRLRLRAGDLWGSIVNGAG
jgi:hypothetical protein